MIKKRSIAVATLGSAAFLLAVAATPASAQVTVQFGNGINTPGYQVGQPAYRSNGYSQSYYYGQPTYSQSQRYYSAPSQRYSSGYRGYSQPRSDGNSIYGNSYQSYRPNYGQPVYGNSYYGNGYSGNSYYGNGYNYGTQAQQRGATVGGAIGNAVGGQRGGNIGAAIGGAIQSQ
ncbi:hypothetical protein K227x_49620 [Rubripirellula lacrimiformis]|uniref:YMGG-like Gly-zipper domain-containing protein n=1 Tax=Rubripirellula lacrimiformis TaxID=1930273 RepID=A0A517NHE8_9BACT|nr:hypothetical protein [Rubripirellula lacrimiformis]QDT06552.1 hypothetical protein K227x_49620 [Rubripirellula lacrimiformis]